jgi:hypothetical protein
MIFTNTNGKRCCFVHIPRTGGTYIEQAICKTYSIKYDRSNVKFLLGIQSLTELNKWFMMQHLTLKEIRLFIENKLIKECDSYFSIVRNPYDRFVSLFKYWSKNKGENGLNEFLSKVEGMDLNSYEHKGIFSQKEHFQALRLEDCKYHLLPQFVYLSENDGIVTPEVFKYEEMKKIKKYSEIQVDINFNKERAKNARKSNLIFLTEGQKERIYSLYKDDFQNFNYTKHLERGSDF